MTKFDFASSLDSCFLDKIAQPSSREKEQIKVLKAYVPHWKEYVLENEIELPPLEEEKEEEDKFCGLLVLLPKLQTLGIQHIPRTLRLPMGHRHWIDHPDPEYSDTLIGFQKYPFPKALEEKCPSGLKISCSDFDVSYTNK